MHNIMLPRVSCYNTAPSYKGDDAASYAERPHPPRRCCCCRHVSVAFNGTTARISTVERKKRLNVDYSRAVTCAFFTNLARWKFSYENRLVQILRENRIGAMPYILWYCSYLKILGAKQYACTEHFDWR